MRMLNKVAVAFAATLALAGCGGFEDSGSYGSVPESPPTFDSADVSELALRIAWEGMTVAEQADICVGWALNRDYMLDAFMSGAGGSIPRADAEAFIDTVC